MKSLLQRYVNRVYIIGDKSQKIRPHNRKRLRSTLNNSEINNFIQGSSGSHPSDNAIRNPENERKGTENTQQQTPNLEKRQVPRGSVSSEESKEGTTGVSIKFK